VRVVLAPDCFGGTLSAVQAAEALADGWRRARPDDDLVLVPMADGGPGFLDALPGTRVTVLVEDPLARPTLAAFHLDGTTAYVEAAQACGLHLLDRADRDPGVTTSYGVGQLVAAAVAAGATTVVLGLGGTATNDGGAGMLAALGLRREDATGERLPPGGLALAGAARLVGRPVPVRLVVASDVDSPLLGPHGASVVFGPQKGATPEQVVALEAALGHWADLLEAHLGVAVRDRPGAGAAGGLGFAALALGATREPGAAVVARAVGLADTLAGAELVVTGEGRFDASSLRGKVVSFVAGVAAEHALPCLVLAGEVAVSRREAAAAGVEAAYSLVEQVGRQRALEEPALALATTAFGVAERWSV
jgi:glycerate kinase